MFLKNFEFIVDELQRLYRLSYSINQLGQKFGVNSITINRWRSEKNPNPNKSTLIAISTFVNESFGWKIEPEDIIKTDLSIRFKIDDLLVEKKEKEEEFGKSKKYNIIDVGKRLQFLRNKNGLKLKDVARILKERFDEDQFHLSHSNLKDMEDAKIKNISVNKLIALASIYMVSLEYIVYGTVIPEEITIDRKNRLLIIPLSQGVFDLHKDDNKLLEKYVEFFNSLKMSRVIF